MLLSDMNAAQNKLFNTPTTIKGTKPKYTFFSDAGHGWLRVTKAELQKLGLLKVISSFSYERGGYVYLEEDGDLRTFVKAKRIDNFPTWFEINVTEKHSNTSSIRRYERYAG